MFKKGLFYFSCGFLIVLGLLILRSISPQLFPSVFIYIFIGILLFLVFSQIDYEIFDLFSRHFYILSIVLLITPLLIGQVTRDTLRWIPIGPFSLQPAEIVRPFLLIFFANFLIGKKLTVKRFVWGILFFIIPVILIFIQPSFGVSILTSIGFFGVLMSANFNKKYIFFTIFIGIFLIPLIWPFLQDYQKERITNFGNDYNTIQSVIGIGSGQFLGRGLGRGTQTQLAFLPEKQTDFIFSSISEELGMVGSILLLSLTFIVVYSLVGFMENANSPRARGYVAGFTLIYLAQVFIHTGMNMGITPVTGVPFPLVSAGGSSFIATMMGLGIALGSTR